jgi:hypothetical protein
VPPASAGPSVISPWDVVLSIDRVARRNYQTPVLLLTAPGPFTLTVLDRTARVNSTAAPTIVNLPSAVGLTGMLFEIKKIDATLNVVTVDAAGAETIDGVATVALIKQWDTVIVRSDGTNWIKLAGIGSTIVIGGAGSLWGNCLFVDIVNGNNATAVRGDSAFPYLTVNAAITAALSGDTIVVRPGTYTVTPFSMPAGVVLYGLGGPQDVILTATVVASTTLINMASDSRIQNVTVRLLSGAAATLTGVRFAGSQSESAQLVDAVVEVDNGGVSNATSSDLTGIEVGATGNTDRNECVQRVRVFVRSNGQGTKRGIHAQASGIAIIRDTNVRVEKQSGGTGSYRGAETTAASTVLTLKDCFVDASVQGGSASVHDDILQSAGTIFLYHTDLVNNDAGGLGFQTPYSSYEETWFCLGVVNAAARFLFPGPAVPSVSEIFRAVNRQCVVTGMRVRARVASGGGNSTIYTLRLNGVATGITVTIAGGTTEAAFAGNVSVSYAIGDDISIQQTQAGASVAADVAVCLEVY